MSALESTTTRKGVCYWGARSKAVALAIGLLTAFSLMASSPASAATDLARADSALAGSALSAASVKPEPVAPQVTGDTAKPETRELFNPQLFPFWNVSLSANTTNLWPMQYSTLTATSSFNVGPTPYYIRIIDTTTNAVVATCGTGTVCSASATYPTAQTHSYRATINNLAQTAQLAQSSVVSVTWHGVSVSLSASANTVGVFGSSTLNATASADVGPSPFWIQIFDATTGTRVGVCGSGTTCAATVSQTYATTHKYLAYVSSYSTAFPPTNVQATSFPTFVTWTWSSFKVSLSAPAWSFGSSATATATVNQDVGPTPYWIQIYNTNGTRLAVCGWGNTCSATFSPSFGGTQLVAVVSSNSTAFLPPNVQATSNTTNTRKLLLTTPVLSEPLTTRL